MSRARFTACYLPWTADSDCACLSPGERTQRGETAPGKERAGTRRNVGEAAAKTALPLTARRPFAGVRKAQATARQRRRIRNGCCKPAVDVRHQTLAGRPETAWRVSGVWLDDRTRSGREPKVSPGQACQKETAILTLSESNIREAKDLRAIMKCQEKRGASALLSLSDFVHFVCQMSQAPHRCTPQPCLTRFRSEIFPGNSLVASLAPELSAHQQTEALFC